MICMIKFTTLLNNNILKKITLLSYLLNNEILILGPVSAGTGEYFDDGYKETVPYSGERFQAMTLLLSLMVILWNQHSEPNKSSLLKKLRKFAMVNSLLLTTIIKPTLKSLCVTKMVAD